MIARALRHRVDQLCRSGSFLIATDFDGTLTPIVAEPGLAVLAPSTTQVLRELSKIDACTLLIISGRSLADLRSRCGFEAVFAGNHGMEIEGAGLSFRHREADSLAIDLAEACHEAATLVHRWPGAFIENKGLTATIHYRAVAARHERELLLKMRRCIGRYGSTFGLRCGKKALEIHPRVGWDKGEAVNWVREQMRIRACICIGDDRTDETMFRKCTGAVTIGVGMARPTAAEYSLSDPASVGEFLVHIAASLYDLSRSHASRSDPRLAPEFRSSPDNK